jgi:mannosyltransferase
MWGIVAFTLLGAALRFSTLDVQSFWSDEAVTVSLVRMDLRGMLDLIPESESTPPLYYLLAWSWTRLFGSGEFGLRSLSALAGTAAIPLAAAAAWTLVSRRAAVATAALLSVNPLLVWYGQEARAYSVLVALCALSFLAFVRALDEPTPGRLGTWAVACILAGATHYFAAFVVVPQAILLLAARRRAAIVAVAAVALGAVALVPLALAQRGTGSAEWISRSALDSRLTTIAKQLLIGRSAPLDRPFAIIAALLIVISVVLLVRYADTRARRGAAMAGGVGVAALLAPLALALTGVDYVITQNVLAALVPLTVAVAAGFAVADPRRIAIPALISLCALSVVQVSAVALDPSYRRADWRGAAAAAARDSGTQLIVLDNDFGGWFARLPFRLYLPAARAVDDGLTTVPQRFPERLRQRAQDHRTPQAVLTREIVVVNYGGESTCGIGSPRILGTFKLVEERDPGGYTLLRYRAESPEPVAPRTLVSCLSDREVAVLRYEG